MHHNLNILRQIFKGVFAGPWYYDIVTTTSGTIRCIVLYSCMFGTCFFLPPYWHVTDHEGECHANTLAEEEATSTAGCIREENKGSKVWFEMTHCHPQSTHRCLPKIIILQETWRQHVWEASLWNTSILCQPHPPSETSILNLDGSLGQPGFSSKTSSCTRGDGRDFP